MASIWYVHGLGASERSFTWLREQFPGHTAEFFTYQVDESVASSIDRLTHILHTTFETTILIGHSLGGVIARACAVRCPSVVQLVTLCAPFGGLKHATLLSLFNKLPVFSELRKYSPLLMDVRAATITASHLAITASNGLPLMNEPNDGVVTIESQQALADQIYTDFPLNHFEVLLAPEVAATINDFLNKG